MKTKDLNKMMQLLNNERYWLNAMLKLGDINKRQAYRYEMDVIKRGENEKTKR